MKFESFGAPNEEVKQEQMSPSEEIVPEQVSSPDAVETAPDKITEDILAKEGQILNQPVRVMDTLEARVAMKELAGKLESYDLSDPKFAELPPEYQEKIKQSKEHFKTAEELQKDPVMIAYQEGSLEAGVESQAKLEKIQEIKQVYLDKLRAAETKFGTAIVTFLGMVAMMGTNARPGLGMAVFEVPTLITQISQHFHSHPIEAVVGGAVALAAYGLLANGLKGAWDFIKTRNEFVKEFPGEALSPDKES